MFSLMIWVVPVWTFLVNNLYILDWEIYVWWKRLVVFAEGRAVAAATAVSLSGNKLPFLASNYGKAGSENASREWIARAIGVSAAGSN